MARVWDIQRWCNWYGHDINDVLIVPYHSYNSRKLMLAHSKGLELYEPSKPNYPVPSCLFLAYEDNCLDLRNNYWQPNK